MDASYTRKPALILFLTTRQYHKASCLFGQLFINICRFLAHKIVIMKNNVLNVCLLLPLCITIASCKKDGSSYSPMPYGSGRTVRFMLYTCLLYTSDAADER